MDKGKNYKLSVIIPVYNTEQYLLECINSVLTQTLKDIQIILVDDASPDNAGVLCDDLQQAYDTILVIHKENEGLGLARNTGLEVATGEYIAFLDSDDYLEQTFYKNLVSLADKVGADICYAGGMIKYSEKSKETIYFGSVEPKKGIEHDFLKNMIPRLICSKPGLSDNISASANMCVFNRQFLHNNKLSNISERVFMCEDLWFQMDCLSCANKIVYSDEIGYVYRYNSESLSRKYNPERFYNLLRSVEMLEKKCCDMQLLDYEERIAMLFWVNFEKCINQSIRFEENKKERIKHMVENPISQRYLQCLEKNRFKGVHGLLCRLLLKRKYTMIIQCLSIYNSIVH